MIAPGNHYDFDSLRGAPPQTMRARCSTRRYFPDPLGIVPADINDRLAAQNLPLGGRWQPEWADG